jgi:hypothetical protein
MATGFFRAWRWLPRAKAGTSSPLKVVLFVGQPDSMTPLGTKGVGELAITGMAAAIANAVYHATGIRVRSLPISIEKVLAHEPAGWKSPAQLRNIVVGGNEFVVGVLRHIVRTTRNRALPLIMRA